MNSIHSKIWIVTASIKPNMSTNHMTRFLAHNLELFESGKYSDLTITCGGQVCVPKFLLLQKWGTPARLIICIFLLSGTLNLCSQNRAGRCIDSLCAHVLRSFQRHVMGSFRFEAMSSVVIKILNVSRSPSQDPSILKKTTPSSLRKSCDTSTRSITKTRKRSPAFHRSSMISVSPLLGLCLQKRRMIFRMCEMRIC